MSFTLSFVFFYLPYEVYLLSALQMIQREKEGGEGKISLVKKITKNSLQISWKYLLCECQRLQGHWSHGHG